MRAPQKHGGSHHHKYLVTFLWRICMDAPQKLYFLWRIHPDAPQKIGGAPSNDCIGALSVAHAARCATENMVRPHQ